MSTWNRKQETAPSCLTPSRMISDTRCAMTQKCSRGKKSNHGICTGNGLIGQLFLSGYLNENVSVVYLQDTAFRVPSGTRNIFSNQQGSFCNYTHVTRKPCVVMRPRNACPEALKVPGNSTRLSSEARRLRWELEIFDRRAFKLQSADASMLTFFFFLLATRQPAVCDEGCLFSSSKR